VRLVQAVETGWADKKTVRDIRPRATRTTATCGNQPVTPDVRRRHSQIGAGKLVCAFGLLPKSANVSHAERDIEDFISHWAGAIDLYKRAGFVLESKKFQEKVAEQSDLELSAEKFGAIPKRKKSAAPTWTRPRWDDAMLKAFIQARDYVRALRRANPRRRFCWW